MAGTKRPDFKHKKSGQALWLGCVWPACIPAATSRTCGLTRLPVPRRSDKNPAWVTQEFGTRGASPQSGSESRSTPLAPLSQALPTYTPPSKAPF